MFPLQPFNQEVLGIQDRVTVWYHPFVYFNLPAVSPIKQE